MRYLTVLVVGGLIGFLIAHGKSTEAQVTYNSLGHKVVVATSDTARNAAIVVGQECGEEGYFVVGTGQEEDRTIMTVECTKKDEPPFWSSWFPHGE